MSTIAESKPLSAISFERTVGRGQPNPLAWRTKRNAIVDRSLPPKAVIGGARRQ
jgi:hypothetical protein